MKQNNFCLHSLAKIQPPSGQCLHTPRRSSAHIQHSLLHTSSSISTKGRSQDRVSKALIVPDLHWTRGSSCLSSQQSLQLGRGAAAKARAAPEPEPHCGGHLTAWLLCVLGFGFYWKALVEGSQGRWSWPKQSPRHARQSPGLNFPYGSQG